MAHHLAARFALVLTVSIGCAAAGCSGDSGGSSNGNPAGPSGGNGGTTCRTYAAAATLTSTTLGITTVQQQTTKFDTAAKTVTSNLTNPGGIACSTTVGSYQSSADFVDEAKIIPDAILVTSVTTTNAPACGGGGALLLTYTYDSQRRITSIDNSLLGTSTYTAWDSAGRPTTGSFAGFTIVNSYDTGARTWTQSIPDLASTTVTTFDANGITTSSVTNSLGVTSTTTFSTTSTAQVCK